MAEINYRLMIEGAPVEWVTAINLEGTTFDGRIRYAGLQYDGLRITEELSLMDSIVNSKSMTVSIRHQKAAEQFGRYPHTIGVYTTAIIATGGAKSDISMIVQDDYFYAGRVVHLGTEAVYIDSIVSIIDNIATWKTYPCYWDTQPQSHHVKSDWGTPGNYFDPDNRIYDTPPTYLNRRAYLFRYEGVVSDKLRLFDNSVESINLDVAPATDWAVGDVITGQTSAVTATVIRKLTNTKYEIKTRSGDYTLGEVIGVTGVAAKLADQGAAFPTYSVGAYGTVRLTEDELIWRGMVSQSPSLDPDGVTWKMTISNVMGVMSGSIGSDDKYYITGIYRPYHACCGMQVSSPIWSTSINHKETRWVTGYYATTDDFIAAINAEFAEIVALLVDPYDYITNISIEEHESAYFLCVTMHDPLPAGPPSYTGFSIAFYDNGLGSAYAHREDVVWSPYIFSWSAAVQKRASTDMFVLAFGMTWYIRLGDVGAYSVDKSGTLFPSDVNAPQNWINPIRNSDLNTYTDDYKLDGPGAICTVGGLEPFAPANRIYCDDALLSQILVHDSLRLETDDGKVDLIVDEIDATNHYFDHTGIAGSVTIFIDGKSTLSRIALGISANIADVFNSVGGFIEKSVDTDLGLYPFITNADIDAESFAAAYTELGTRAYPPYYIGRGYGFTDKTVVKNILIEELRLIGYFAYITDSGAIGIKKIESSGVASVTLTDNDIVLTGNRRITYNRNKYGVVVSAILIETYEAVESKFIINTEYSTIYKTQIKSALQIKPFTEPINKLDPVAHPEVFVDIAEQIVAFMNSDYDVITIPVTELKARSISLGTWISITSSYIINTATFGYGITLLPGYVIGRDVPLDPAADSAGSLTVICRAVASSSTLGTDWDLLEDGPFGELYCMVAVNSSIALAGTGDGHIIRGTMRGNVWTDLGQMYSQGRICCICHCGSGLVLAGTGYTTGRILWSADYGATWLDNGQLGSATQINAIITDGAGNCWAGSNEGNLYVSTDSGSSWTISATWTPITLIKSMLYIDGGYIIVSGTGGTFRSTDSGATWSQVITSGTIYQNALRYLESGIVFLGEVSGYFYRSDNFGADWTHVAWYTIGEMCFLYLGDGVVLCGDTNASLGHIYRSTDYGATWTMVADGDEWRGGGGIILVSAVTDICRLGNSTLVAATSNGRILRSNYWG